MLRIPRPTYANVTATLALVVALGGTSYAAVALAPNSVGTAQLKTNAVTSAKVKDRSLLGKDFKAGQLPRGARGARGPAGVAGPLLTTLPAGKTLTGLFALGGYAPGPSSVAIAVTQISFAFPLATAPEREVVPVGGPPTADCPGTSARPAATSGHLCIYETFREGNPDVVETLDPNRTTSGATFVATRGAMVFTHSTQTGSFDTSGSWAVTG